MQNKMSRKTKSTLLTVALTVVALAGGLAIGSNAETIYDAVGDKLGFENVIEDEKKDETNTDQTDDGAEDEVGGETNTDGGEDEGGAA